VIVNDVQTELADAVVAESQSGGGKASASYRSEDGYLVPDSLVAEYENVADQITRLQAAAH